MTNAMIIVAMTLWHECRGEPLEGRLAVASVIANRVEASRKTPEEICMKPFQFSCWNILKPSEKQKPQTQEWEWCVATATLIIERSFTSTGNWTHYCRHDCRPTWRKHALLEKRIGDHVFMQLTIEKDPYRRAQ